MVWLHTVCTICRAIMWRWFSSIKTNRRLNFWKMLIIHNPKLDIKILKIRSCIIHETSKLSWHEINHQRWISRLFRSIDRFRLAKGKIWHNNEKTYHLPSVIALLHYKKDKLIKNTKLQGGLSNKEISFIQ